MIANAWTQGPAVGAKDSNGRRREWTREDAARLAQRSDILTPSGTFKVRAHDNRSGGQKCPFCGQMKAIVKPYAATARWCFGCGRAS